MGRLFDGSYAEYTSVPVGQVQVVKTKLSWDNLGALPEMMQTAWGSLYKSLQLKKDDTLLIRGGTTSIGLAAAALAKGNCASIAVTTRRSERVEGLKANGVDDVFIDHGSISEEVRKRRPEGYSKVLELVGITVIGDSLKCVKEQGTLCLTGIAGGKVSSASSSNCLILNQCQMCTIFFWKGSSSTGGQEIQEIQTN
jgi:NADPH:quinone reductase-like Zn-dependent oxidoreductase